MHEIVIEKYYKLRNNLANGDMFYWQNTKTFEQEQGIYVDLIYGYQEQIITSSGLYNLVDLMIHQEKLTIYRPIIDTDRLDTTDDLLVGNNYINLAVGQALNGNHKWKDQFISDCYGIAWKQISGEQKQILVYPKER